MQAMAAGLVPMGAPVGLVQAVSIRSLVSLLNAYYFHKCFFLNRDFFFIVPKSLLNFFVALNGSLSSLKIQEKFLLVSRTNGF